MHALPDTFTSAGLTYDSMEDSRPGMSAAELREARQVLWRSFQDDPDVVYYLGQFYRRRADPAAPKGVKGMGRPCNPVTGAG